MTVTITKGQTFALAILASAIDGDNPVQIAESRWGSGSRATEAARAHVVKSSVPAASMGNTPALAPDGVSCIAYVCLAEERCVYVGFREPQPFYREHCAAVLARPKGAALMSDDSRRALSDCNLPSVNLSARAMRTVWATAR